MKTIEWAAGVLEGEGCFSIHTRKKNNVTSCAIHCEMSDEDVVRALLGVFKQGTVIARKNDNRKDGCKRKPTWIWSVQNKNGVLSVLEAIRPFMGKRRSAKIKQIMEFLTNES